MSGKSEVEIGELKNENIKNCNSVKVYSSKSILSYQNGSASVTEAGVCDVMESSPDKTPDYKKFPDSQCCDHENLNSECLDLLRKKLISDLSLQVFSTDLENKIIKMEPVEISKERLSVIQKLLLQICQLSDAEKLLLYLKLQSSTSNRADPLRQPLNPLGNRQEIQQTIVWIKTHLEEDRDISIPKQDVYDQYLKYCGNVSMKPLSTADFGKVMKQVYPGVRPRRLGTRGNSRYCYSGMRNTLKLPVPSLPRLVTKGSLTSGNIRNDSDMVTQENEKSEKSEKAKRKWKTPIKKNYKMSSSSCLSKPIVREASLKCPKRSKVENLIKAEDDVSNNVSEVNRLLESDMKTAEKGIRNEEDSIHALGNILASDLRLYLEKRENSCDDNKISVNGNFKFSNRSDQENGDITQEMNGFCAGKSGANEKREEISMLSTSRNFDESAVAREDKGKIAMDHSEIKSHKLKLRKQNSFLKSQRNFTKAYVPIQPKPVNNTKPKVHFELDRSAMLRVSGIKESESPQCEESDSQEPEEEIVRYFRHLEENQFLGISGKVNNIPQIKYDTEKILNLDQGRSQSCFDEHSIPSTLSEQTGKCYSLQRSHSSVEFYGELPKKPDHKLDCGKDNGDKISHLRLLLETSIATKACVSQLRGTTSPTRGCKPFSITSFNGKFPKQDSQKVLPSPNKSCRFFNFTPISPSSQSPLKTPSPFISPRETPIPRSRQNSFQNEHFIPPSKTKENARTEKDLISARKSGNPVEELNESVCEGKFPEIQKSLLSIRPRSNSSTNFHRARAKRSLSKVLSCDLVSFKEPNPSFETFPNQGFTANATFSCPLMNQNMVMADSLSGEIRQFVENDWKIQENQCGTSRSQSVPLNRMAGESSWQTQQTSPIYDQCVKDNNSEQGTQQNVEEFVGFEQKSLDSFIPNEQMSLDGMNEVFTRENSDIGYQMFEGNFVPGNTDNTNDNSFNQNNNFISDGCFPSKIELAVNPFPGAFSNESDNMKPYITSFEATLDTEDKMKEFSNSLYDGSGASGKDPIITSFKPVFMGELSSCPTSPVLGFFGSSKGSDDNQLIEFLTFDG